MREGQLLFFWYAGTYVYMYVCVCVGCVNQPEWLKRKSTKNTTSILITLAGMHEKKRHFLRHTRYKRVISTPAVGEIQLIRDFYQYSAFIPPTQTCVIKPICEIRMLLAASFSSPPSPSPPPTFFASPNLPRRDYLLYGGLRKIERDGRMHLSFSIFLTKTDTETESKYIYTYTCIFFSCIPLHLVLPGKKMWKRRLKKNERSLFCFWQCKNSKKKGKLGGVNGWRKKPAKFVPM